MLSVNDTVMYIENDKNYVATVLGVRTLDHHMGSQGEPLLHLGFFKVPLGSRVVGTEKQSELVQFRLDVVHKSHSFDSSARAAGFTGFYPGGRWDYVAVMPVVIEKSVLKQ